MIFRTKISPEKTDVRIDHRSTLMLLGSCFSQNIGQKLLDGNFDVDVNPFGVLYNPSSIAKSLTLLLDGKKFTREDLFEDRGFFNSFHHHSSFSSTDESECLFRINDSAIRASAKLSGLNVLIVTFGTSYVFSLKKTGKVVSNCHKIPASFFERKRLTVSQIVDEWGDLLIKLRERNPQLKVVFTVSPIRHWKDGAHGNQLSKSILLLAIDELQHKHRNISYFPSYELLLDDLRDYRFYAEDMIHPNEMAISYIWEYFAAMYFSEETKNIIKEWRQLVKSSQHRTQNEMSKEYQDFLKNIMDKLLIFKSKYSYLDCSILEADLTAKMKG